MRLGLGLGISVTRASRSELAIDLGALVWLPGESATVSSWVDQSGNGHDFVQASAPLRPTTTTLAGQPALAFAGGQYLQHAAGFAAGAPAAGEIFVVLQLTADPSTGSGQGGLWSFGSDIGDTSHVPYTSGVIYDSCASTARKTTVDPTPSLTSARIYSVRSASGAWSSHLDGVQLFTTATNTVGWNNAPTLGADILGPSSVYCNGKIACLTVFPRILASDERAAWLAELSSIYGITV